MGPITQKSQRSPRVNVFKPRPNYFLVLLARRGQPDLALVEGLEAQVRHEPADQRQPEAVLENRLAAALDAIVGDGSRTTLLILDEFQALANTTNDNFVAAFRAALQRHQGKLLIFYTGSSREALSKMFRRQKAPLFESAYPLYPARPPA